MAKWRVLFDDLFSYANGQLWASSRTTKSERDAVFNFANHCRKFEQERIIKLINDTAGEICGNSVHIINGSCLCDLIVRIKGENK
jgi:hypothetical protein